MLAQHAKVWYRVSHEADEKYAAILFDVQIHGIKSATESAVSLSQGYHIFRAE